LQRGCGLVVDQNVANCKVEAASLIVGEEDQVDISSDAAGVGPGCVRVHPSFLNVTPELLLPQIRAAKDNATKLLKNQSAAGVRPHFARAFTLGRLLLIFKVF